VPELLLEILSEEIPARMQAKAADDLKRLVCDRLKAAGLTFTGAGAFVTPRRLALVVEGLPERQPDITEEKKGREEGPESGRAGGRRRGFPESQRSRFDRRGRGPRDGQGSGLFCGAACPRPAERGAAARPTG
jgi:glycyl-tRNA synthetase beta chain